MYNKHFVVKFSSKFLLRGTHFGDTAIIQNKANNMDGFTSHNWDDDEQWKKHFSRLDFISEPTLEQIIKVRELDIT